MSIRTRRARVLSVAGALLFVAGVLAIIVAVRAQRSAPQPSASAARPVSVTPTGTTSTPNGAVLGASSPPSRRATADSRGPVLSRSVPVRLQVPAIGLDSTLERIGLNSQGEIMTPPLVKDSHAYWLTVSPTPGQLGPATIIGHVDSAAYGPGVFFKLGALRQRDQIAVTRADGTVATFEVQRTVEYKKNEFPTQQIYGNLDYAGLRLITCGGTFNSATHSYESNIVVYAALVSTRHI